MNVIYDRKNFYSTGHWTQALDLGCWGKHSTTVFQPLAFKVNVEAPTLKLIFDRSLAFLWKDILDRCMDKLQLTGQNLGRVFSSRRGCMCGTHLFCFEAKLPSLKLKTRPKQLLGSLPLAFALPDRCHPAPKNLSQSWEQKFCGFQLKEISWKYNVFTGKNLALC